VASIRRQYGGGGEGRGAENETSQAFSAWYMGNRPTVDYMVSLGSVVSSPSGIRAEINWEHFSLTLRTLLMERYSCKQAEDFILFSAFPLT